MAVVDEDENHGKPADAKKKHHDNLIIIVVSIVGVFITYLIYRRSSSSGGGYATAIPAGYGSAGNVAGSSQANYDALVSQFQQAQSANQQAMQGFQGYLSQLDQELQTIMAGQSQAPGNPKTPTSSYSQATALGFTNPNTPVEMVNGTLIDTLTGRKAYYGPNGQPGSAGAGAGLTSSWQEPGGTTVWYNPSSYGYADPNRAPDLPPAPTGAA